MTDLHCHVLPGIDDGAKNMEVALALLQMQCKQGIKAVAFTPHFNCAQQTVPAFLQRRAAAARQLVLALRGTPLRFRAKLGAEVYAMPQLPQLQLSALCLQGTSYLLLELPITAKPVWLEDLLYEIQLQGFTPLIAHIERYPYLLQDPMLVYELVSGGALTQVNASSLLRDGKSVQQIIRLLQCNLVHAVATDTHSVHRRPPLLAEAMQLVRQKAGVQAAQRLTENAQLIFDGDLPEQAEPQKPRKLSGLAFFHSV